jgi:hypothetical protein
MKAQITVSVDPTSFVLTGNPTQTDIAYHVYVTNTTNQTVNLYWGKRMTGNPVNWTSWICDNNLCFDYTFNSCPLNKPNVVAPGDTMEVQVHMNPANTEGSADYELNILDVDGTILASVNGQILISNTTAVKETNISKLTVYPNPTQDYFQISDTPGLRYIEMFSIVGNKMKTYDAGPQKQYYVGDLVDGVYLVRLLTSSGKVLKTVRLSKR